MLQNPLTQVRTQMQPNLYTASTWRDDVSLALMSYKGLALTLERRHVTAEQCVMSVFVASYFLFLCVSLPIFSPEKEPR